VFHDEIQAVYKDSFFRFGVIEVGYAANWILNPNAQRPLLNTDKDKEYTTKPKSVGEPQELPVQERIYFKHIPARCFRVGGIDHRYLHRVTWCGYYEYVDKNDLLAIRSVMNRSKIEECVGTSSLEYSNERGENEEQVNAKGDYVKIWHIWHNKAKLRLIVLDEGPTIFQRPFDRLNLIEYRPDKRVKNEGFYPIPPVYHWISPQDEINETREQMRKHRRRFNRKFQVMEGMVDDEEIEKFENGDDGALVKVKQINAISAIQDAPLGQSLDKAIMTSDDDMNKISGTTSAQRATADRTTATEAQQIGFQSSIRTDAERSRIARFLIAIGRETLLVVRDKFTLGVWVKLTADNPGSMMQEYQTHKPVYDFVTSEDLNDGYDFRIQIDVTTLSASGQEDEKKHFLEFLAVVTQYPQVAMSPKLIREAAYRVGYRNEAIIKEMQDMALLQKLAQMHGIQQAQQGLQTSQQLMAAKTPNDIEQIRQGMQGQLQQ
jgi:Mg2+ and Co2+ transporter CorA